MIMQIAEVFHLCLVIFEYMNTCTGVPIITHSTYTVHIKTLHSITIVVWHLCSLIECTIQQLILHLVSLSQQNWAVLHLNGPYQPVARDVHTAFSLQDPDSNPAHPRLVISCGMDNSGNPLRDMCILSVNDGSCEEVSEDMET